MKKTIDSVCLKTEVKAAAASNLFATTNLEILANSLSNPSSHLFLISLSLSLFLSIFLLSQHPVCDTSGTQTHHWFK